MEKNEKPILKIPLTGFDKAIEAIVIILLLAFWIFTLTNYRTLPEIIPTHFVANGKADGYGLKWTILTLPSVATLFYVGLSVLAKYPHKFNYATTITVENAPRLYTIATQMLRVMKLAIILVLFLMEYETVQLALAIPDPLSNWYMMIDFTLIFVPLFYFLIKTSQNA